jgi:predicted ATPase
MKRVLSRHFRVASAFDPLKQAMVEMTPEEVQETESLLAYVFGHFSTVPGGRPFQTDVAGWGLYPEFEVGREAPARRGIVSRTERRLEPDGANLISVLHTLYESTRDFKQDIDDGMHAVFGPEFGELLFPPEADQRIELRLRWKSLSRTQSAADLSDGTLRFLRLLTILANPDPPSLIAIDEPEAGLHPAMQRIVAEYAVEASRRSQVVLTTHSPEFLDAFVETCPTTTIVESQDGQTRLKNLSGDALKQWVKNFSLGEILRTGEASMIEGEKS